MAGRRRPQSLRSRTSGLAPSLLSASFSGNERNHFFLSAGARTFPDLGGISGLDHAGDTRAWALLDFDRDGWQDLVLVNANAPFVQLFQNRIGSMATSRASGGFIVVRFEGGNHTANPSTEWSNRDGIGARIAINIAGTTLTREHSAGEGFASQHSASMMVGIGHAETVDSLSVRWPSGRTQVLETVPDGSLVTLYENPDRSPSNLGFVVVPYQRESTFSKSDSRLDVGSRTPTLVAASGTRRLFADNLGENRAALRLYTSMATWCGACMRDLAQVEHLRSTFTNSELALIGVPIDPEDDNAKLDRYLETHRPAYELLLEPGVELLDVLRATVIEELSYEGIPATVVTDADGIVLRVVWGVPSVSTIRALLASLTP